MNNIFYATTLLTMALLSLFYMNKISSSLFVILLVPLSIAMLIIGIIEFKKTISSSSNIEHEAKKFKKKMQEKNNAKK